MSDLRIAIEALFSGKKGGEVIGSTALKAHSCFSASS
jgi:hypothetical protein